MTVRVCGALILMLVGGFAGSSVAADASKGAISAVQLSGAKAESGNPTAPAAVTQIFRAPLNMQILVAGWAELYDGCFYNSGHWTVTSPPQHGAASFGILTGEPDPCGNPILYAVIYYTWTDATARPLSVDMMSATWQSDDGLLSESGTWVFIYTRR